MTNSLEPDAKTGDMYLLCSTSGNEKEIFDSKIIIMPYSRVITRCIMPIFQGNIHVTFDGARWSWTRSGEGAAGELKMVKIFIP